MNDGENEGAPAPEAVATETPATEQPQPEATSAPAPDAPSTEPGETAAAPVADAAAGAEPPAPEAVATDAVVDVTGADLLVPMVHPEGGTCDLYETEGDKILVPAADVPTMADHGFVVAVGGE